MSLITTDLRQRVELNAEKFREDFVKAELGNIVSQIIMKSTPDDDKIYTDDAYVNSLKTASKEVTAVAFDNLNNGVKTSGFVDSLIGTINDYATKEADYRKEIIYEKISDGIISTQGQEVYDAINKVFQTKKFSDNVVKQQYRDDLKFIISTEGVDIIDEIRENVIEAVTQTEEKNKIINITLETIKEEKEDLKKIGDEDEEKDTPEDDVVPPEDSEGTLADGDDGDGDIDDGEGEGDEIGDGVSDDSEEDEEESKAVEDFIENIPDVIEEQTEDESADNDAPIKTEEAVKDPQNYEDDSFYQKDTGMESILLMKGVKFAYEGFEDIDSLPENEELRQEDNQILGINEDIKPEVTEETIDEEKEAKKAVEEYDIMKITKMAMKKPQVYKYAYSNESISTLLVPLSLRKLDKMTIPTTREIASVFAKASQSMEDLETIINARFINLNKLIKLDGDEGLQKKCNELNKRSTEAFAMAKVVNKDLFDLGFTPYSVINKDSRSLFLAKNIVRNIRGKLRYNEPKQTWREGSLGVEDAYNALFDILLIKDKAKKAKNKNDKAYFKSLVQSREDVFVKNIAVIPEEEIENIKAIRRLEEVDFKQMMAVPNFIENLKLDLEVSELKSDTPVKDVDEHIFEVAKARVEETMNRELVGDELEIIKAMCSGYDASDFATNIFEKFTIKVGTDSLKNNSKIDQQSAESLYNKALVNTVIHMTVDKLNMLTEKDKKEFENYMLG